MRQPIIIATLNDGIEPEFPSTDVPKLSLYAQIMFLQELDRNLSGQLPGWWTEQGINENDDLGIAIKDGLMTVQDVRWVGLESWRKNLSRGVVVVRANYLGCQLSLMSTHRPTTSQIQYWPQWNSNLAAVVKQERLLSRTIIVGLDTNESSPQSLQDATHLTWHAPFASSICGFLTSGGVDILGTAELTQTGEHPPVVGMALVPVA